MLSHRARALVFVSVKGKPISSTNWRESVWGPAVIRAGLADRGPTPHDLRHSHVAHLIDLGCNMKAISARLGHSSIKTTMDVYGHLFPDHEEAGLEGLDHAAQRSTGRKVSERD